VLVSDSIAEQWVIGIHPFNRSDNTHRGGVDILERIAEDVNEAIARWSYAHSRNI